MRAASRGEAGRKPKLEARAAVLGAGANPPRGRFYTLAAAVARRPEVLDPKALAAWMERRRANPYPTPVGVIGQRVTAIEYRDRNKGAGIWRHDFRTKGARLLAMPGGKLMVDEPDVDLFARSDGKLWAENPPRRREGGQVAHSKRRPPRGFTSWASWSVAMRRRQHQKGRKAVAKHNDPARHRAKKRKHKGRAVTRHVRRNPPQLARGLMGFLKSVPGAVLPSTAVVGGKIAARAIPALVMKAPPVGLKGLGMQLAAGVLAALGVNFVSPLYARYVLMGAIASVEESYLRGVRIGPAGQEKALPIIGAALGDATELYALSGYYFGPRAAVGEYLARSPQRALGDSEGPDAAHRAQMMVFG
jgi:hypothetical protein